MNKCSKGFKEDGREIIECPYSENLFSALICMGKPEQCYWWRAKLALSPKEPKRKEEPPRGRNIDLEEE